MAILLQKLKTNSPGCFNNQICTFRNGVFSHCPSNLLYTPGKHNCVVNINYGTRLYLFIFHLPNKCYMQNTSKKNNIKISLFGLVTMPRETSYALCMFKFIIYLVLNSSKLASFKRYVLSFRGKKNKPKRKV